MCRLLGLLLFVLTTPVSISAATPVPNITDKAALEAFVDGVVESGLSDHNVAGSVVAIVKDDRLLLAKGYGQPIWPISYRLVPKPRCSALDR